MRGFTLIETIIYIAILALLLGSGIAAAFYIIDSSQKNKTDINVQAEGNFILGKIAWALSGASAVSASGNTLTITKPSLPASENPLVFSLSGNKIRLRRGSGSAIDINSSNAPVSAATFSFTPSSGKVTAGVTIGGKVFNLIKYLRK